MKKHRQPQSSQKLSLMAQTFSIGLLALGSTLPALADTASHSAALPVRETFKFDAGDIKLGRDYRSGELTSLSEYGDTYECGKGKLNALKIEGADALLFPFIQWRNIDFTLPLKEPYFTFEPRFFGRNQCWYYYSKIQAAEVLKALGPETITEEMTFDRISEDGTAIEASVHLRGDLLKKYLITGRSELHAYFKLNLEGCTTEDGVWVPTEELTSVDSQGSIRDMIRKLRERPRQRFTQCMMRPSKNGRLTPELTKMGIFSYDSHQHGPSAKQFDHFMIQEGAEAIYQVDYLHQFVSAVPRVSNGVNPGSDALVHQAVTDFIEWLKGDYLDFLDQLNTRNPGAAERSEALKAFALKNKAQITRWLSTMDENLASLPLMNKMSILMSISQAYQSVGKIEAQAKVSEGILDQIIVRRR